MDISLYILLLVLILITCQQLLPIHVPIWVIMLAGAVANIVFQQITIIKSFYAVNWNVMGFLFGVFFLAQYLEKVRITGYLTEKVLKKNRSHFFLLAGLMFLSAISSMFLMNDAVAIIGVPVCLRVAKRFQMSSTPWLLTLAFSVTIGSMMSPIGNPQNLLIAVSGVFDHPFVQYFSYFFVPSFLCLGLLLVFIYLRYYTVWKVVKPHGLAEFKQPYVKKRDVIIASLSIFLFLLGVLIKVLLISVRGGLNVPFCWIALCSVAPVFIFSSKRVKVLRKMDWCTLVFFVSMFIVMSAVWQSNSVQAWVRHLPQSTLSVFSIIGVSTVLSQLISNVPTAALYLPVLSHLGAQLHHYLALVCGATISGMLTIVGAASNLIILQNVQQRNEPGFSAFEFMAVGLPLGLLCLVIYYLYLVII